jgi:hypothetical protein
MPVRALPWVVAVGLVWIMGGLHLDGWAHVHGRAGSTPFTVWHAVFYSGMLATGCALLSAWLAGRRAGASWRTALPPGYGICLLACFTFLAFAIGDLVWHVLFGIESSFSALMSPTHLGLYASIAAIGCGALAASWREPQVRARWSDVVAATMLLSVFTFWSIADNLFADRYASGASPDFTIVSNPTLLEELGVLSVMYQSAVTMAVALTLVRRFRLPAGAFTVLLGGSGTLLLSVEEPASRLIVLPIAAGVVADVLYALWKPSLARPRQLRYFALAVPVVLYGLYFAVVGATEGIWWPVHIWAGAIFMAGAVGLLISFLVAPVQAPVPADPFADAV